MNTSTLTVAALVALCKERRIRGYSGKSKADLVALLDATTAVPATVVVPVTTGPVALSLFSGAGGDTLGLERAGYTVVAFSEFKAPAIQTHQAAFPSSTLLQHAGITDITALPDATFEPYRGRVNVLFGGAPCFVAGTRVLTNEGYMPIEDVTLDHTLMTHTGTFKPIVNLQRKLYDANLYDIRIKYHPEILTATNEHPFYVRERIRHWNNDTRKYFFTFGPPTWKAAKDLTDRDFFGMVVNQASVIPEFTITKPTGRRLNNSVKVVLDDPDQWFMMGYFIGDGWIEDGLKSSGRLRYTIRFAIHQDDKDTVLKRLQKVLKIVDKHWSTGKCDKYGCGDIIWHTILKKFGKYSHGKKIPEWVQDAPPHLIQEFLDGYYAADGCKNRQQIRYTTVSYNLALGVQRLYLKLGNIMSIQKTIRPRTCVIQGRTVNQRDTYVVSGYLEFQRKQSSIIQDGYAWLGPASIECRATPPVVVYNFEVNTDNSYIVDNTIVHNCQGFSHAGKKNPDDPRNELIHQVMRVADIVQPPWILFENVRGLLSRTGRDPVTKTTRPVIDILNDLFNRHGYKITYRVLNATSVGVAQVRQRLLLVAHRGPLYPRLTWPSEEVGIGINPNPNPPIRPFLEAHLTDAMELPAAQIPADLPSRFWIHTDQTDVTGTPHPNLVRLVRGIRNASGKEKAAHPDGPAIIQEPGGLISFGVRKGGYHGEVMDPDRPSKTIICTYNLCPRLFVGLWNPVVNKHWVRCLTVQELAQIQGFPADYPWRGTTKEAIIQIGNAVPPPLVEHLAKALDHATFHAEPDYKGVGGEDEEEE